MADYKISCEGCSNYLSFSEEMLGLAAKCPSCGTPIQLASPPAALIAEPSPDQTPPLQKEERKEFDRKKTVVERHITVDLVNQPDEAEQIFNAPDEPEPADVQPEKESEPEPDAAQSEEAKPAKAESKGLIGSLRTLFGRR